MYHVILNNKEWATSTFGFQVDKSLIWTALVVGISAIIIIRSKLAKVGNFEIGGEWAYLWSRARVLNAVNKQRIKRKGIWQEKFRLAAVDVNKYQTFFTDLEQHLKDILTGRPDISTAVQAQLDQLREEYSGKTPNQDAAVNASEKAREYLISVALDYLGHKDIVDWANQKKVSLG
jgi:hypothetical protein